MKTPLHSILILLVLGVASGCSKHNSDTNTPPAGSTSVTVTISFPDGHTYTCTDYSVVQPPTAPGVDQIDGRVDTTQPVIWLDDNNLDFGWDVYTYGLTGVTPGKTYSLIFSTPNQYENTNVQEEYNKNLYKPTLAWALGSASAFEFEGSVYDLRQLTVSTTIADSFKTKPTSGSFSVQLVADSVFTATSRTAYSGVIQITGTFNNLNIYP
jgi:hypothetical protein